MAYNSEDMRLMGGVPGQQLFIYRTFDDFCDVRRMSYFNDAIDDYNMTTGDIILACAGRGRAENIGMLVVCIEDGYVCVNGDFL
jgi:hypothetical protein